MTDGLSARADGLTARARAMASGGDAWWVAGEAMRRAAAGDDIIALTIGDPAGPPPPAVLAATTRALATDRTHYSPLLGEPALRAAAAADQARHGARPVAAENIVVMPGAQHALLAVMAMVAGPGDEVILVDPYYPSYPAVVAAAGATAVTVPAGPGFAPPVDAMIAALTPRTRAILVNAPANPTGAAATDDDYRRLAAAAPGVWLIADEVYARFRFAGAHVSLWDHGDPARTVVLSSLSKSHRMSGFRIGWAIAPPPLMRALGDWSAASLFGVSQFAQDAAVAALAVPDAELAPYWAGFAERAARVVGRAGAIPGLRAAMPAGGMFVMLDVRDIMPDDVAFATALLAATGVAVIPGSGFGAAGAGHVRVGLTADAATLDRAFDRIAAFVDAAAMGGRRAA